MESNLALPCYNLSNEIGGASLWGTFGPEDIVHLSLYGVLGGKKDPAFWSS